MFSRIGTIVALSLLILTGVFDRSWSKRLDAPGKGILPLKQLPYQIGEWSGEDTAALNYQAKNVLQLDDYVRRFYSNKHGRRVFLYVGYWKKQGGDYQAAKHSPLTCLPANGWKIGKPEERVISIAPNSSRAETTHELHLRRLAASTSANPQLFYYWFFAGTQQYSEESSAIINVISQTIRNGRSDGGIVEISTIDGDATAAGGENNSADSDLKDFVSSFYPLLEQIISSDPNEPSPHQ